MRISGESKHLSEEILQQVCREIGDLLPCDRICLALPSSDATRFTLLTAHPTSERRQAHSLRRKGSRAAQVLRNGSVEYSSDLRKATPYPEDRILKEQGVAQAAFVPIGLGDRPGCVLILGSNEPGGLEGRAAGIPAEALGRVAAAIGAAGGAQEESGSVLRRVAELSRVASRIIQEDDLDTVCRLFLEAVQSHSGYTRAVLTLMDDQGGDLKFFFNGFDDRQIDHFHAHKPTKEQRESIVREGRRIGSSYLVPATACNGGGLLPGAARDLLFVPLYGSGPVMVGTVMLAEPAAVPPAPESLSLIELFAGQMGHAIQKKRLDREIKSMEARLLTAQSQLLQAEKMSAIGLLISGVTHELNNPLSGVMGFAQLLLASEVNPKTRKHLERIHSEAVRSQKIVQNLLSFARRHKPQKTHEDLNRVIDGVLDLRAYQLKVDNVELVRRYDPGLPKTMLDFHQLQQVILNVVNNSHHAMMEVGDRPRRLVIETRRSGPMLRASFTDSGTGIPKDRLESIFDPFFTTKRGGKGTGLGLSVSRAIIKDHHGAVTAESVVGEGTTIHIDLPLVDERRGDDEQEEEETKTASGPPRSLRLLVVDDEMILVELLTEFLKMNGHKVDEARNGQTALKLATANTYDVILSDLKMPGLDGQGFYERLLKIKPDMARRFIFTTGDLANPKTQAFFQSSGCPYLSKPFRLETVLTLLQQIARNAKAA